MVRHTKWRDAARSAAPVRGAVGGRGAHAKTSSTRFPTSSSVPFASMTANRFGSDSASAEIPFPHRPVKAQISASNRSSSPRPRAAQAGLLVDVEQQRAIGTQRAGAPVVECAQPVEIEAAARTLIGGVASV